MVAGSNRVVCGGSIGDSDRVDVVARDECGSVRWRMTFMHGEVWLDHGVLYGTGPAAIASLRATFDLDRGSRFFHDEVGVMFAARDVIRDPQDLKAIEELFVLVAVAGLAGGEP